MLKINSFVSKEHYIVEIEGCLVAENSDKLNEVLYIIEKLSINNIIFDLRKILTVDEIGIKKLLYCCSKTKNFSQMWNLWYN